MAGSKYGSIYNPGPPGLWHTPAYQSSGAPWITGSLIATGKVQMMKFPTVSKSFTLINTGSDASDDAFLYLAFNSGSGVTEITECGVKGQQTHVAGSDVMQGKHYLTVAAASGSITMNVKSTKVYIINASGFETGYQIFAELTGIQSSSMYNLTGSGVTAGGTDAEQGLQD